MRFLAYLRPGVIVGPLPNIILDGQVIDAVPVMNDFNWLVSQVNANVPPLISTGSSPVIFVPASGVGGTGNAITLTPTTPINAYAAGQCWRFVAKAANTGAITINVSGLGNRNVTYTSGNGFAGGEFQVGGTYDVTDNGTQYMVTNFPVGTGLLSAPAPVLSFGGGSTGITYASQVQQVMTLGNWVMVWTQIILTAKGSSTGLAAVTLPVRCAAALTGGGSIAMGGLQLANVSFSGFVGPCPIPNTTSMNFGISATGAAQAFLVDTNFTNTSQLLAWVMYFGTA